MAFNAKVEAAKLAAPPADKAARQPVAARDAPRFLIVTHDPVWPPVSGYDIRNWLIARSLSRHGEVVLASVRAPSSGQPDTPRVTLASLAATGTGGGRRLRRWRTGIEPRLTVVALAALERLLSAQRFDMTLFAGVGLAGLIDAARSRPGSVVLDMHNVESDLLRQKHRRGAVIGRLAGSFNAWRARRFERGAIDRVDIVMCCSSQDRDRAIALHRPRAPLVVVPNGSLPRDGAAARMAVDGPTTILYAGHLGYWPNVDAAQRLARRIFPLVRAGLPQVRLMLAGRSPKRTVRALGDLPGVSVIADPPDMGELLDRATLTVIPLESGGGTRIKILEAMTAGLPVVATRIAAEGLDLAEGLDYLAGETDAELAEAAISLCRDDALAAALGKRARIRAAAGFGEMAIDDAVDEVLRTAGLMLP